jgi:hypothetical protein
MSDRPPADTAATHGCTQSCGDAALFWVLLLTLTETQVRHGFDPDGSQTIAAATAWTGSLARIAPAVRFRDTPAGDDDTGARLMAHQAELRRLAPLLSRLRRPGMEEE